MQQLPKAGFKQALSAWASFTFIASLLAIIAMKPAAAAPSTWCVTVNGQPSSKCTPTNLGTTVAEPSAAASMVGNGDTIIIVPGTYVDCSVWTKNNLTIEAAPNTSRPVIVQAPPAPSPTSSLPDPGTLDNCPNPQYNQQRSNQTKALFDITGTTGGGNNVTVNGITFENASNDPTSEGGNGAGIRVTGSDLDGTPDPTKVAKNPTIENCSFDNNQSGILVDAQERTLNDPSSTSSVVTINGSSFIGDGANQGPNPAHPIYVGYAAQLSVDQTGIFDTQAGANGIQSRAALTSVTNSEIWDDSTSGNGDSSYLISVNNGGSLTIMNDSLEKGQQSTTQATAIGIATCLYQTATVPPACGPNCPSNCEYLWSPGSGDSPEILVSSNTFQNDDSPQNSNNTVIFVNNYYQNATGNTAAYVCGNTLTPGLSSYTIVALFQNDTNNGQQSTCVVGWQP